jgi:hypothetical protein
LDTLRILTKDDAPATIHRQRLAFRKFKTNFKKGDCKMTASSIDRVFNGAQKELQSFLGAVAEVFGSSKTQQAGCLWIEAVKNAGEIDGDGEKFFHRITIQVAGQMAATHALTEGTK